jgi:hypothetical protein
MQDGYGVWQVMRLQHGTVVQVVRPTCEEQATADQRLARCERLCTALERAYSA